MQYAEEIRVRSMSERESPEAPAATAITRNARRASTVAAATGVIALACVMGSPVSARSATLQVASTGVDGPTCGGTVPCRSISQAIVNAAAGDKIVVGPGYYSSDLNADGLQAPGDEPTTGIAIDKPLQIVSKFGASSTIIRSTVLIEADGVVFGKLNNGFTIATSGNPLLIGGNQPISYRVGGNVIVVEGPNGAAGVIALNTQGRLENNRVVSPEACSAGFFLINSQDLIAGNVVLGCTAGFHMQGSQGARLVRNTALGNASSSVIANGVGFDFGGGTLAEFTGNVAIGNGTGVSVGATIASFRDNTLAGNHSNCGVRNFTGATLDLANNYWGAPTGPGTDPADAVCDGPAVTAPFLTVDPTRAQAALR